MGKLCSKFFQSESISQVEVEKEIKIPSYKSKADRAYELIENKYNLLQKLNITDFMFALSNFSNEKATLEEDYLLASIEMSMNESFFTEQLPSDMFQSFIENKILKHKMLYTEAGNNEKATSIFKDILLASYNGLALKLSQDAKSKGKEADKSTIIRKCNLIPYGVLMCNGYNYTKIHLIFNLFKTGDVLKTSEQFTEFLLSLFLLASYGMANARNKTSKYEEIGAIEADHLKELLNVSELQDNQNLVKITNEFIFGKDMNTALTYQEFKNKFEDEDKTKSLGYILSLRGIRSMLEANNVD